ncbi:head protein [Pantoea eucrina]|uniref:antirestriction phage head protein DarA n=1 Tax=Pantoea eucrina TaxID=472693 RepID=UPI0024B84178|nr:head protein [Pantoea eucrina]MDJ0023674.1 head protein [Pantoea eucrina]
MSEILKNRMVLDFQRRTQGAELAQAVYDGLMTGSSADMMLESATIDDIDHAYLGEESVLPGAMFEAISTERMRLAQTMRAFVKALNRGLNGTDIIAGTDDAGADTTGQKTVGGAVIGKVRRVASIPVLSALIPLSDGQTVSLVFHSPTADNGKIRNQDTLVAFQFLINKRDVTHIVAPIGGRDVSLQQVTQALSNLIEKNSGKFTKQKDAQAKLRAEVETTQAETDQLAEQQSALLEQVDTQTARAQQMQGNEQTLRGKLASQKQLNADLTGQLAALQQAKASEPENTDTFSDRTIQVKARLNMDGQATLSNGATVRYHVADQNGELEGKVIIIEADGTTYEMPSKSSQGAEMGKTATKMLKAYRTGAAEKYRVAAEPAPAPEPAPQPEPEPAPAHEPQPEPVTPATVWRYALVNRPAGIGAVPPNFAAVTDQPAAGEPYSGVARNGIISYDRPLTDKEIADFELKLIPTHADLDALAATVAEKMSDYAAQYLEMSEEDPDTYAKQVRMVARKQLTGVAYPEGEDEAYFTGAIKAALQQLAAGEGEETDVTDDRETTEPFWIAAKRLGDLVGWASDLVNAWAEALGYGSEQLKQAADYVEANQSPEYLKAAQTAMITGKRIPLVEELNTPEPAPEPQPEPEPEPAPQPEPEPVPEADSEAQKAIDYLQGLTSLDTDDMDVIRAGRNQVREAIAALTAAGVFDENEALVNGAVQHLSDLLVAVQRKGVAA